LDKLTIREQYKQACRALRQGKNPFRELLPTRIILAALDTEIPGAPAIYPWINHERQMRFLQGVR